MWRAFEASVTRPVATQSAPSGFSAWRWYASLSARGSPPRRESRLRRSGAGFVRAGSRTGPTASGGFSAKARAHAARGSAIRDANDRYYVDVVKCGSDGGIHGHGRCAESDGDARSKNAFDSFAPR